MVPEGENAALAEAVVRSALTEWKPAAPQGKSLAERLANSARLLDLEAMKRTERYADASCNDPDGDIPEAIGYNAALADIAKEGGR
jgi:hypothetical protein